MLLSLISAGLAVAATSAPAALPGGRDARASLDSLVAAERAFSRLSVEKGMRDAFLTFLSKDGVVFQPLPVNGQEVWRGRKPSAATLIWEPSFAEIAAAGDLGYTTGPWELQPPPKATDRPVSHGHFISVWRRGDDGSWKVAVDLGISHSPLEPGVGSGAFNAGPSPQSDSGNRRRNAESEIRSAERTLSSAARKSGLASAILDHSAADVRFNRDGGAPALGHEAARALLADDTRPARWVPRGLGASRSGDLGYSYGIRERLNAAGAVADSSVYLDIWRRNGTGQWQLALVVDNPIVRRP